MQLHEPTRQIIEQAIASRNNTIKRIVSKLTTLYKKEYHKLYSDSPAQLKQSLSTARNRALSIVSQYCVLSKLDKTLSAYLLDLTLKQCKGNYKQFPKLYAINQSQSIDKLRISHILHEVL